MFINTTNPCIIATTTTVTGSTTTTEQFNVLDNDEWEEEITIIKRRRVPKKPQFPTIPPQPKGEETWVEPYNPITNVRETWVTREPCMFDGLPDGAYGIACPCSRHRTIC